MKMAPKINRLWPKCNLFWRWLEYINMPNLKPFLSCFFKKPKIWPRFKVFIGKYNARNMFNEDTIQNKTKHTHKKNKATQLKLELERPRFEDTPRRPMITHTIDQFILNPKSILLTSSYRIPSQNKVKAEKLIKIAKNWNFKILL